MSAGGKYVYGSERACVICTMLFRPRDRLSVQSCCSNVCRGVQQTRRAIRQCSVCDKPFLPAQPSYRTCSRKCGTVLRLSLRNPDPMVAVRGRLARFCCEMHRGTMEFYANRRSVLSALANEEDRPWREAGEKLGVAADRLVAAVERHAKASGCGADEVLRRKRAADNEARGIK